MKCYVCDEELTSENLTEEHIIINAAGGRLKSKNLICRDCNTTFGEGIDRKLAEQLNHLANMLMIERHRGEPPPLHTVKKSTGEKVLLEVGGIPRLAKPKVSQITEGSKTEISIQARTEEEMRQILTGISKKHPGFDVDEAMKNVKWYKDRREPLQMRIEMGGMDVFRAVCKCAVNFFILNEGLAKDIKHLIPFIQGKEEKDIVWMHFQDGMYDINPDECFHILHLVANKQDRTLYCYVDYFNTYRYIVLLNDNYQGESMKTTYVHDLINLTVIERQVKADYDRATLLGFFSNKDPNPFEKVKKAMSHSLALAYKRQDEKKRDGLLKSAIETTLGRYPEGTLITKEMADECIEAITKNIISYLDDGHNLSQENDL